MILSDGSREPTRWAALHPGGHRQSLRRVGGLHHRCCWRRLLWAWLSKTWAGWRNALVSVKRSTVIAWQRRRLRDNSVRLSRIRPGRPKIAKAVQDLIDPPCDIGLESALAQGPGSTCRRGLWDGQAGPGAAGLRAHRPGPGGTPGLPGRIHPRSAKQQPSTNSREFEPTVKSTSRAATLTRTLTHARPRA